MFDRPILALCVYLLVAADAYADSEQDTWTRLSEYVGSSLDRSEMLPKSIGDAIESYEIVLEWHETAVLTQEPLVGIRLVQPSTGDGIDLYFDSDGNLLDEAGLADAGVLPKRWGSEAIDIPTEYPSVRPALAGAKRLDTVRAQGISATAIRLPPFDLDQALLEDAAREASGKGENRVGAFVEIPVPIEVVANAVSDGRWRELEAGRWGWAVSIVSPEATGIRLALEDVRIPSDAEFRVYPRGLPRQAFSLADRRGDFWAPLVQGDAVTLEIVVSNRESMRAVQLAIPTIIHQYKDIALAPSFVSGSCNNDVACEEDWIAAASAVAGIAFVDGPGLLFCTGTLVADGIPESTIPYFLTADHCISSRQQADSLEVFWLYQRDGCESGNDPNLLTVPRSSAGADLLVSTSMRRGTDVSLLRLREDPPLGVGSLGGHGAPQPRNTPVAVIHHPRGDVKKLSFGEIVDVPGTSQLPASRYYEVVWNDGTTEPGSSGSPLLTTQTQQIVGQLYGGSASCSRPNDPDYFGRSDVSFELLGQFLQPARDAYDLDASGKINAADVQLVVNAALGKSRSEIADVDNSGLVDSIDVQIMTLVVLRGDS